MVDRQNQFQITDTQSEVLLNVFEEATGYQSVQKNEISKNTINGQSNKQLPKNRSIQQFKSRQQATAKFAKTTSAFPATQNYQTSSYQQSCLSPLLKTQNSTLNHYLTKVPLNKQVPKPTRNSNKCSNKILQHQQLPVSNANVHQCRPKSCKSASKIKPEQHSIKTIYPLRSRIPSSSFMSKQPTPNTSTNIQVQNDKDVCNILPLCEVERQGITTALQYRAAALAVERERKVLSKSRSGERTQS